ncbi:hypothetical protein DHD80_04040 [Gramella sp. AN32]|nr:hypothetical protein [Gramella sp. AN32]
MTINCGTFQDKETIEFVKYETFTRGSTTNISVHPNSIQVKKAGMQTSEYTEEISVKQWKEVLAAMEDIEISSIGRLETSTEDSSRDAAAQAVLSIKKNDSVYITSQFDDGNAPKAVKPLVEAILRLAENVE